jgi:hypothetical protein
VILDIHYDPPRAWQRGPFSAATQGKDTAPDERHSSRRRKARGASRPPPIRANSAAARLEFDREEPRRPIQRFLPARVEFLQAL